MIASVRVEVFGGGCRNLCRREQTGGVGRERCAAFGSKLRVTNETLVVVTGGRRGE